MIAIQFIYYYPECHFTCGWNIRVGFPTEQIDEETGQVVHEYNDEEVVQHADRLTQHWHGVRPAKVHGG